MSEYITPDEDLSELDRSELTQTVMKLRRVIRYHRDQKGDERCWLDDVKMYQQLPEEVLVDATLPPKEEFLESCRLFHQCRQGVLYNKVDELYDREKFEYTSAADKPAAVDKAS